MMLTAEQHNSARMVLEMARALGYKPVRVSRSARGKLRTGLDHVASNLDAILGDLKSACAAGGTIRQHSIEILGNHRTRALAVLRDLGPRISR